ncbi:MAG: leucine-rich repeat domain-containing protein, partial [Lachnospiraceae bacterium]|nr:leucine-rich repeat domain-containing protein [Lachnospiraceae bacterium]
SKADDGVICNYNFDDVQRGDASGNSAKLEIVEGLNSTYNGASGTNGSCVRVFNRNGYWENSAFAYKIDKLEVGKRYVISFDARHENGVSDKFETDNRAIIIHYMPDWQQIGQPTTVFNEDWEHVEWEFTLPAEFADKTGDKFIYLEFAYPEPIASQGDAYKVENKEEYYIDNFCIKEYVQPTAAPVVTPTPAPTPTAPPVVADPTPVPIVDEPGLELGYEEAVKGITYIVTGKDTVAVGGFETPKTSLSIPATITLEGYTYKVTAINAKAFKDDNIKSLTIGANVATIGKSAFQGCTSLKKITIKSTVIKSIGKSAFKKTSAKATVKVPKAKKKAYKKLLQKAGLSKKAKVK